MQTQNMSLNRRDTAQEWAHSCDATRRVNGRTTRLDAAREWAKKATARMLRDSAEGQENGVNERACAEVMRKEGAGRLALATSVLFWRASEKARVI